MSPDKNEPLSTGPLSVSNIADILNRLILVNSLEVFLVKSKVTYGRFKGTVALLARNILSLGFATRFSLLLGTEN